jgi:hypothetical protein
MATQRPIYLDSNNDLCSFLTGDWVDITAGGTGANDAATARTNLGVAIGTNVQAWDADLDALAALPATAGFLGRTGAGAFAVRTLQQPAAGLTISNSNSTTGDPVFALANDLASLEAISGFGYGVRISADNWIQRTLTATNARITISNPAGTAGNSDFDLATLTDSGTGTLLKITRDAYGRVSGTASVVIGDISPITDTRYLQKGGDTMTGTLTLAADPVSALQAATKQYVDNSVQGLDPKQTATLATTAALPANTYSNGASGVGATLTATGNALLTVDAVATTAGMLVLVKNEVSTQNNGLYVVTNPGSAGAAYVLTRSTDMDLATEFSGGFVPVGNAGTANANSLWLCNPVGTVTVGTTGIPFTQLNKGTDLVQGNGILINTNTVSVNTASSARITVTGAGVDLASGIVTTGTYTKLTVDTYGRVTAGATATPSDIGAQPADSDLTALAAIATTGLYAITATGFSATRSLAAPAAGFSIGNADGVAGNPTFTLTNDLAALEGISGFGFGARISADNWIQRSMATASTGRITILNPAGTAGDPTFDLASGIATPGTYYSVTVDTYGRVTGGSSVASTQEATVSTLTNNQGSAIVCGRAVYSDTSGTYKLAQSNAVGTRKFTGLQTDASVANAAPGVIATAGVLTLTTVQWDVVTGQSGGLTTDAFYYLSGATAGALTSTAPTTGWVVRVGKALSTTKMVLCSDSLIVRVS